MPTDIQHDCNIHDWLILDERSTFTLQTHASMSYMYSYNRKKSMKIVTYSKLSKSYGRLSATQTK